MECSAGVEVVTLKCLNRFWRDLQEVSGVNNLKAYLDYISQCPV